MCVCVSFAVSFYFFFFYEMANVATGIGSRATDVIICLPLHQANAAEIRKEKEEVEKVRAKRSSRVGCAATINIAHLDDREDRPRANKACVCE